MKQAKLIVAALLIVSPLAANAVPIIFVDDQAGFDAALLANTLALAGSEDWESSTLGPASLASVDDSIQPGVASAFLPGGTNVGTGMTVQSNTNALGGLVPSPRGNDSLAISSAGFLGTPTFQVSNNFESDSMDLIFNPGVMAVSLTPLFFDLFDSFAFGAITIRAFGTTNIELGPVGGTTVNGVDYRNADRFFGIVAMAGEAIGRLNLFDGSGAVGIQGVDNIDVYQRGVAPPPPPPTPVPEPGMLVLFGIGLAGMGLTRRRKKA